MKNKEKVLPRESGTTEDPCNEKLNDNRDPCNKKFTENCDPCHEKTQKMRNRVSKTDVLTLFAI